MDFSFSNLSNQELSDLIQAAGKEIENRHDTRFKELVGNVVDAIIALRKEFPCVYWFINDSDFADEKDMFDYIPDSRNKIIEMFVP